MTEIKEAVRQKYGQAALRAGSCCGTPALEGVSPITSNLYSDRETGELPEAAVLASLGCGNPTALAELKEGETVLDLGSGGGIDVLLSARRVGPSAAAPTHRECYGRLGKPGYPHRRSLRHRSHHSCRF